MQKLIQVFQKTKGR